MDSLKKAGLLLTKMLPNLHLKQNTVVKFLMVLSL